MRTRVVLIPGWNEGADSMQVFAVGRRGLPGLAHHGYDCATFDGGRGSLTDRIDQLSRFIAGLRAADSTASSVALFGYSAGGLVARGLLRAYPDAPVETIFQLAAPNAGIVTDDPRGLFRRIHFDQSVIEDLDVESPFMAWINKTSGHWDPDGPARDRRRWKLDLNLSGAWNPLRCSCVAGVPTIVYGPKPSSRQRRSSTAQRELSPALADSI